jgi:hypothetical protein
MVGDAPTGKASDSSLSGAFARSGAKFAEGRVWNSPKKAPPRRSLMLCGQQVDDAHDRNRAAGVFAPFRQPFGA